MLAGDRCALGGGQPLEARAVFDVALHRQPGEQGVGLKDHAAIRAGLGDRLAVEQDAAAVGADQPGDDAQQRRFAAAARPDDADKFAVIHVQREVIDGDDFVAAPGAKGHGDVVELKFGGQGRLRRFSANAATRAAGGGAAISGDIAGETKQANRHQADENFVGAQAALRTVRIMMPRP